MRKTISVILVLIFVIIGCNQSNKNKLLQTPDEMQADEYVVDIDRDTTLVTKNGALLKIPKGALSSSSSSVTLEIKEAFSISQMVKGGLTTQTNGELLSSGGMIYINAKAGQEVTITKAINVAIPATHLEDGMQLYKGNVNSEGEINWANPDTLPDNKQLGRILQGRQLFMGKCASCHNITKDGTGPSLAHYLKRYSGDKLLVRGFSLHIPQYYQHDKDTSGNIFRDGKELNQTLENIESMLWDNQFLYFCNLKMQYGSLGTSFSDLNVESILSIYQYIQNESDKLNLAIPSMELSDCVDSCQAYQIATDKLTSTKRGLVHTLNGLTSDSAAMVKEINNSNSVTSDTTVRPAPVDFEEKVSPENYQSRYYQFTIETFGWFNIDILINGQDGVEESELFVRLSGEYRKKAQVYLIIPSSKVYTQGGPAVRNQEEFAFLYKTGKIFLPQGVKAYILAVSESSSSTAFVVKEFVTGRNQAFDLAMESSTKEVFNAALSKLDAENLKVTVNDTKHADEIRQTEKNLQNIENELKKADHLKPKGCNCNCGQDFFRTPDSGNAKKDTITLN